MHPPFAVKYDMPLSNYSTLGIGGRARELFEVYSAEGLLETLSADRYHIVGNGSNILFADDGAGDRIIAMRIGGIEVCGAKIRAGAGTLLPAIAAVAAENSLTGLEWACGIPAALGGALKMNAGAFGGNMEAVLESCEIFRDGSIITVPAGDMGFSYRSSGIGETDIVLSATLALGAGSRQDIDVRMQAYKSRRRAKQPSGRSCGSVFKNGEQPAGFYIDRAGLKGLSVGDLVISEKHANFILNKGKGRASDFLALVNIIKTEVYNKFGVILIEEFIKIGDF